MSEFNLRIVTPFKLFCDENVEGIIVTTTEGEMMVLPKHINYAAILKVSKAKIKKNGTFREVTLAGGLLEVSDNKVAIITHAAEYVEDIDLERAQRAKEKVENKLLGDCDEQEKQLLEYKLKKAINRISSKK